MAAAPDRSARSRTSRFEATLEHIAPKGVDENGAIQFEIRAALKPSRGRRRSAPTTAPTPTSSSTAATRCWRSTRSLLQFEEGKPFVEVETAPQTFEKREIKTGLSDGITIEVLSGPHRRRQGQGRREEGRPSRAAGGTRVTVGGISPLRHGGHKGRPYGARFGRRAGTGPAPADSNQNCDHRYWFVTSWWNWISAALDPRAQRLGAAVGLRRASARRTCRARPRRGARSRTGSP